MSSDQLDLTHEEVWDDSALIDSWNEALEEYKKYHSLHAKKGTKRDLEALQQTSVKTDKPSPKLPDDAEVVMQNADEDESVGVKSTASPDSPRQSAGLELIMQQSTNMPAPPIHAVLGSVQDESLKKLLMSWYYAGYYTGLYEGQQQSQQTSRG